MMAYSSRRISQLNIAVLTLGMAATGAAYADSYALSYNDVMQFSIQGITAFDATASTSADSATHHGDSPIGESNSDNMDALQSFRSHGGTPVEPAENTYTPLGMVGDYSRGDSMIGSISLLNGGGAAMNIAEAYVIHTGDLAEADARNNFSGQFTLDQTTDISFEMMADPYMEVVLDEHNSSGSKAQAELGFLFTITNMSDDTLAYEYTANDLNHSISALTPGDSVVWDPTGDGMGGNFNAYGDSFTLEAGTYNLSIGMVEAVGAEHLDQSIQVPAPGGLALMGAGLLGLGLFRRRIR